LTIAVSTEGVSPSLAADVRDAVGAMLPENVDQLLLCAADVRRQIRARFGTAQERQRAWRALVQNGLFEQLSGVVRGEIDSHQLESFVDEVTGHLGRSSDSPAP
jgi:siroheme synthase (precorrin-2 oxidase/ferrochelatase)